MQFIPAASYSRTMIKLRDLVLCHVSYQNLKLKCKSRLCVTSQKGSFILVVLSSLQEEGT
ncbi:hypothetical protein glysoja_011688 [Glycine soja]|nr:hypothetical protein glysoja_011688 [Glycine soja]